MARLLFGVPMAGGWAALILGLFLFIVGSLALGFLVSTVARNQLQAMQMSFFYFLPSILLSGFLFPFRGMPRMGAVARHHPARDPHAARGARGDAERASASSRRRPASARWRCSWCSSPALP